MAKYKLNDEIAWNMFDGNIMAGRVTWIGFDSVDVQRVDGGCVRIPDSKESWIADGCDVEAACEFYTKESSIDSQWYETI